MPLMKTFSRPEISGMEAGPELDERRDAALDGHGPGRGLRDAGDELQRGALARSVPADDAEGAARRHREGDVRERGERLVRLQIAQEARRQERALERRELAPCRSAGRPW